MAAGTGNRGHGMSRMFSAMTGPQASARPAGPGGGPTTPGVGTSRTVSSRSGVVAEASPAELAFVSESDENPFVEIGGPTGTVFSRGPEVKPVVEPEAVVPAPPVADR